MRLVRQGFGVSVETGDGLVPLRAILGIGRNYAEHAAEMGGAAPERPMVFMKSPWSLALDGEPIELSAACLDPATGDGAVDFEGELAVVIGRAARDVAECDALLCVLGYACANDVSARWWQKHGSGGQFCRGKSFDTFCPIGPTLAPPSAVADPQRLRLRTRVNGQTMQDASTAEMIFPVATLISELSRGATLAPGTVILTGTPSGVGAGRTPPVWLKPGDTVEVEIESVGVLRNGVAGPR